VPAALLMAFSWLLHIQLMASLPVAIADWSSAAFMSCETNSADGMALASFSFSTCW
jgi:hypothetical protein